MSDAKTEALLQLLGGEAAEKLAEKLVAGFTPEQRMELARTIIERLPFDKSSAAGEVISQHIAQAMKEQAETIKAQVAERLAGAIPTLVRQAVEKLTRGY